MKIIRVGLYGENGHQIHSLLPRYPQIRLTALAAFDKARLAPDTPGAETAVVYSSLEQLLADPNVDLVSLCSPRRCDQARDAIRCLRAGKHVYAEKPCALNEADLDAILAAARETGRHFHEMAGTAFEQPFLAMRHLIRQGVLGEIVQVFAQKSYPMHEGRPQDEDLDGGLLLQVGVHAFRFVEHVTGVRIRTVSALETQLANPRPGALRTAASVLLALENGAVGAAVINYLNPRAFGHWGNEALRIFGRHGFVEAVDGASRTRLVLNDRDEGPLPLNDKPMDFFGAILHSIATGAPPLLTPEDELHPTRMALRAKACAELVRPITATSGATPSQGAAGH